LDFVYPECRHYRSGHGTDEQLVGLVEHHEGKEDSDNEPTVLFMCFNLVFSNPGKICVQSYTSFCEKLITTNGRGGINQAMRVTHEIRKCCGEIDH
jgi:hypothetical protein